jgi:hypothetical protein
MPIVFKKSVIMDLFEHKISFPREIWMDSIDA